MFFLNNHHYYRRELVWPELDQLLGNEDGKTASTPYAATILEYRVEIHDPENVPSEEKMNYNANGHAVVDAQHPCRCIYVLCLSRIFFSCNLELCLTLS